MPDIRVYTACCDAFKTVPDSRLLTDEIKDQAQNIGYDLLREFRRVFPGNGKTTPPAKLVP